VSASGTSFKVRRKGTLAGTFQVPLLGVHNVRNALVAIAVGAAVGLDLRQISDSIRRFEGVKRRLELRGSVEGIRVYDDFAHHPTAIDLTIDALRRRIGTARLVAVFEPRSNTMKLGTHRDAMAKSLERADRVWLYQGPNVSWDVAGSVAALGERACVAKDIDQLVATLGETLTSGDHVLIMSNGGFGGIHKKLLERLAKK
jgi:UDP-N-acetylmuramate: L-alanyl-gamma-D-glutamyl-meso-diaminopimelate ligase